MDYKPQRKHRITLKDKAIFTAFVIILIVIIAILINLNYYNSVRENLTSADFMVSFAITNLGHNENLYSIYLPFIQT
jgi:hypothetical protein